MIINILDSIIAHALEENWTIKYVAMEPASMDELVNEVISFAGKDFTVDAVSMYKDVPLYVKDIIGLQVAYEF